ncbi:hypothetical protein N7493_010542 [Penicillium malachiteum]|uniref:NB-ARC domain-containing protein n=1 Tax=Penicillium malachiteum TaxID=1324776 RepID=A0AAD6MRS1_9EURO|nr:hypothetical protein N7493_010542 [Penicillium malachiteum]
MAEICSTCCGIIFENLSVIPVEHRHRDNSQSTPSDEGHWMVPFDRNPRFIGRDKVVKMVINHILSHRQARKAAISGLGGVGKTQIALEVAYQIHDQDPTRSVLWMESTSIETVEQAFMSIKKKLQLRNVTASDVKSRVKAYLSSERAGPWLFIIDNADDTDITFLPTTQNGFIIFTTRNQQLATRLVGPDVVTLSELDEAAAFNLLKASLVEKDQTNDQESMTILVRQLHGLPLALNQAASFINENCISLKRYLSILNQQETSMIELLGQDFEDDYRYPEIKNPIAATWFVSFQQIQKSSKLAAEYLSFMACIDPRDIPLSLLPQHPTPVRA